MKRVNTLYRVSTKGQVFKDDIPLQRESCLEFIESKSFEGWTLNKEYYEKGVSGFKVSADDRDVIQELKAAALNNEFDVLLVYMFDRLGRIQYETPFVVKWFTEQGIEVWSVNEGQRRFENHVDDLMNFITFWQASGESIKTSTRVKDRKEQLTTEGCFTGGEAPYGYKLAHLGRVNKKGQEVYDLEIAEDEAAIVQMLFCKTVNEGCGSYRLASYLNSLNLRTHKGSEFQPNTVNRILKNHIYLGYIKSGNAQSECIQRLKIINDNLFEQAQNIVTQRISKHNDKRRVALNTKGKTLLSGNIFCAHCGGRLVVTRYQHKHIRKDGSEYKLDQLKYTCYHKTRKLCDCDGQTSYLADRIDKVAVEVLDRLFRKIKDSPQDKAIERKYKEQISVYKVRRKKVQMEVEKFTKEMEALKLEIGKALTGESKFSPDWLGEALETLKEKLEISKGQLSQIEAELTNKEKAISQISYYYDQFVGWANEFEHATLEQKKMIAGQLLKKVNARKGYELDIELDVDYQQFCAGL